ncbi:brachyurin-like [Neocloeon triangulifer]|uniref:brachyurin-like n=1 Tax=Neocloeon triangulifer TaxID=2078957 RepID=UPI00286F47FD|nr:brachyurin-like [Neocloeon triangulifer]
MKSFLCLLAIVAFTEAFSVPVPVAPISDGVSGVVPGKESRVLGGSVANTNEFPHMVAIFSSNASGGNTGFCGGSLISNNRVITAGHCIYKYDTHYVVLGTLQAQNSNSQGYTEIRVSQAIVHPLFDISKLDYDLAMLVLERAITPSLNINPMLLPRRTFNTDLIGKTATLSGWGKINDDPSGSLNSNLLKVTVPIVNNQDCFDAYGAVYVNERKVCVSTNGGLIGACYGDSGSPLIYYDAVNGETVQVGTMSFGAAQGCTAGFPTMYTRITSYTQWIADNGGPPVRG